jgi:dTDP-4-amino-4,6-dideoxygalactose transaminase
LAAYMRRLRDHGSEGKYRHTVLGHNYRLEALQGAILNVKLKHLEQWTEQRRAVAAKYDELLANIDGVNTPLLRDGARHVYHLYVIQAEKRDKLREYLEQESISTGLHYPVPLHLQPCFANLGYKIGAFPNAEKSANMILSLPMYPELSDEQIEFVADKIRLFYKSEGGGQGR